jgi:hypothetical protein
MASPSSPAHFDVDHGREYSWPGAGSLEGQKGSTGLRHAVFDGMPNAVRTVLLLLRSAGLQALWECLLAAIFVISAHILSDKEYIVLRLTVVVVVSSLAAPL